MSTTGPRRPRGHRADMELLIIAQVHLADICRDLRRRRRAARIRQGEIADALGVDVATISSWENLHKPPLALNLFAWVAYLDTRLQLAGETP